MNTTTTAVALVCSNTMCCQEAFGSLSFHVDNTIPCLCLFPRFPACNGSLSESAESLGILTSIQSVLAVAHIALLIFIVTVVTSRLSNANVGTARFSVANLTIFFCIYASVGRRADSRLQFVHTNHKAGEILYLCVFQLETALSLISQGIIYDVGATLMLIAIFAFWSDKHVFFSPPPSI
jgi:hypothetical protein